MRVQILANGATSSAKEWMEKNSRVISVKMNFYHTVDEYTMSGTLVKEFTKLKYLKTLIIRA